jgi:hypothetical protein
MSDSDSGPLEVRSSAQLGAALTRWIMHDNHTFTKLSADDSAAYELAMQCFDDDGGYVDLCGTWSDERDTPNRRRPKSLQSGSRDTRAEFAEAALRWLHANPGA